jgi:AcrR family transcriptional regulator
LASADLASSGDRESTVHGQDRPGHQARLDQIGNGAGHVGRGADPAGGHAARGRRELGLALAAEVGYGRLTIEGIAARAGVGKQTIYRWWPSKADILLEAGAAKADLHVPVTDYGSYRADLRAFLEASYRMASFPALADLLRALIAEAQIDPEFGDRFRAAFLQRRRDALAVITDRARERGDLPARPDPGTVADIVFGSIWYRTLATRQPLDAALVDNLVGLLAPTS